MVERWKQLEAVPVALPDLTSPTVTGVGANEAALGGTLVSAGGAPVTERGIVYSLTSEDGGQLTRNVIRVAEGGTGTGAYTVDISDLVSGKDYSYAAYAENAQGRVFSKSAHVTTDPSPAPPAAPEGFSEGAAPGDNFGPASAPSSFSAPAVLAGLPAGSLDPDYNPGVTNGNAVFSISLQPNGGAIIGGEFRFLGGVSRDYLARLRQDGSVDAFFTTETNDPVNSVAIQPDGKIVIGGRFDKVNDASRTGFARLNEDGSLESEATFSVGTGADGFVYSVALQADGKILIGGLFTSVQGFARPGIARLKANGQVDTTFDPGDGADEAVYSLAVQPDGKILVGGHFTDFDGTTINRVVRLETNGAVDGTFDPGTGADDRVTGVSVQPNGDILVCGYFTTMGSTSRSRIARLLSNGTLDTSFDPGTGADNHIYSTATQLDGKILIGGLFQNYGATAINRIARLDETGALDLSFDPGAGANSEVDAVVIEENGSILIGGTFSEVDGTSQGGMARFATGDATESLTVVDGTRVQWMRGGATSVVSDVKFELSEDGGASFAPLGAGAAVPGGWELGGQSLPVSGVLKVLGRTNGGFLSGSSGVAGEELAFVRQVTPPVDNSAAIAALNAQIGAASSKLAKLKKQFKKAKKKKQKSKAKKIKKLIKKVNAQIAGATAQLGGL